MCKNHPLFSLENIYQAYRQCRKRKRNTVNAMKFEQNLEENLITLHEELTSGSYKPDRSVAFLVQKPKRREIFAADFRDRVVHHLLVGYLEPSWERRFIHDSYACRKEKGTHKGVERLQSFTRKVTANGTRRAWYLQLDVRGFFIAINRHILYQRLAAKESDPTVLWLTRTLLFYEPTENCIMRRARRLDFEGLPTHKTLFKAQPNCGLPIGNLTSQFFANVYLDTLDQFVKHQLKVRYYLRYCDDFILLAADKATLERQTLQISQFLADKLHLTLNERQRLRPVSDGIDFLGYIVRPNYRLVRNRVVGACFERLMKAEKRLIQQGLVVDKEARSVYPWPWPTLQLVYQQFNSYLGHFRKANSYRLVERLWQRFPWLTEYFWRDGWRVVYTFTPPRPALRLAEQRLQLCDRLPNHMLLAQIGGWWEVWGNVPEDLLPRNLRRFPENRLSMVKELLWSSKLSIAWIAETGRRITTIAERTLVCRWVNGTTDLI
ncbi:MAG: hypothetical protein GY942_10880 [Aestuariibacter sp.]|nr:hypothetical protein [Aestuariibacter sp.]